ncbi:MAG: DNA modification methylase [Planctomycetota bacterium]|nr:DNA modification methylase [Planctomycetota bacterium]
MRISKIPVSRIKPALYNPRKNLKPDDPEYQRLVRSLEEFGCVELLIWNQRTGNLVGGHQRFKVLVAQGAHEIDVSVVNLSLNQEKALNIALNKVAGEWDDDKLTNLLAELIADPEIDVEDTGFDLPDVEQLLADVSGGDTGDAEQFDVASELANDVPTVTQKGELLELGLHGEHRVLCGDAIKPADVRRLMGEHRAALCHTDPPYGVNYDRRSRPTNKAARPELAASAITNDDLTPKQYRRWFAKVVAVIADSLPAGAPFYFWNSHKNFGMMHDLLAEHGCKVASVITWGKESFSLGFGDYNEQVEYCLYGWKGGARHRWYGPKNASTLWQVHRDRTRLYRHPTQKPLELAERAVRNSSKAGDIVLDAFMGSGTTLIACARLGRRCFGLEIDPRYCDCIVRRYIALAGQRAVSTEIADRYRLEEVPA